MNEIEEFINLIKRSEYIVAFTGAGISTESGIPQFRGKKGLWEKYSPEIYGTLPGLISQFLIFPEKVTQFVFDFLYPILNAKPNISHFTLAEFEKKGYLKSIITQNIDNLHQEAGSKKVIELHGNIYRWRCKRCKKRKVIKKEELLEFIEKLKEIKGRKNIARFILNFIKCECGRRIRPEIVFFGEFLPEKELEMAENESKKADLFIIIGTSGLVKPASELPYIAKENGARIVEINKEKSYYGNLADIIFNRKSTEVFEEIKSWLL